MQKNLKKSLLAVCGNSIKTEKFDKNLSFSTKNDKNIFPTNFDYPLHLNNFRFTQGMPCIPWKK